jgi:hypothetical protein
VISELVKLDPYDNRAASRERAIRQMLEAEQKVCKPASRAIASSSSAVVECTTEFLNAMFCARCNGDALAIRIADTRAAKASLLTKPAQPWCGRLYRHYPAIRSRACNCFFNGIPKRWRKWLTKDQIVMATGQRRDIRKLVRALDRCPRYAIDHARLKSNWGAACRHTII